MQKLWRRLGALLVMLGLGFALAACGTTEPIRPDMARLPSQEAQPLLDEDATETLIASLPDPDDFATAKDYAESEQRMAAYESIARDASQIIANQLVDGAYGKTITDKGEEEKNSASGVNPGQLTTTRIDKIRTADGSTDATLWWVEDQEGYATDSVMMFTTNGFSFIEPQDFQNYWTILYASEWTPNLIEGGAPAEQLHDVDVDALRALAAVNSNL